MFGLLQDMYNMYNIYNMYNMYNMYNIYNMHNMYITRVSPWAARGIELTEGWLSQPQPNKCLRAEGTTINPGQGANKPITNGAMPPNKDFFIVSKAKTILLINKNFYSQQS